MKMVYDHAGSSISLISARIWFIPLAASKNWISNFHFQYAFPSEKGVKKTVAHTTTAAPPLLPLLHALEWLTVLLQGYVRPHRQYGEGAPVTRSPPKVFTKHKYVYVIPATSPYYNNPQALFNLYKPVHTPQPMHTPQRTSSVSTTTPTQSPTTHPQSTATSMSISPRTPPRSSWKPLPPPLPLPKPSSCLSTNPFSSLTTDPLPPSSTSHAVHSLLRTLPRTFTKNPSLPQNSHPPPPPRTLIHHVSRYPTSPSPSPNLNLPHVPHQQSPPLHPLLSNPLTLPHLHPSLLLPLLLQQLLILNPQQLAPNLQLSPSASIPP